MRVNFFSPALIGQALLPRMLARGSGAIVHVSSVAGRIGNANEAAYSASKFALCGWAEATAVDLWDTPIKIRLVNPGPIDTEIWDLPGNDDPLYQGRRSRPRGRRGNHRRDRGRRVRALSSRHEGGRRLKQQNIDGFLTSMATMMASSRSRRRADREGAVFGVAPQGLVAPADANELAPATSPPRRSRCRTSPSPPLRPDWVVAAPILTGICGSDSKQILMDFGEGDSDNAMSGLCSFPQVMGHEVVAEVVELGPEARGLDVGQRVVLNPWLSCAPRGISPVCPACEAGDLSLCWSFADGRSARASTPACRPTRRAATPS